VEITKLFELEILGGIPNLSIDFDKKYIKLIHYSDLQAKI